MRILTFMLVLCGLILGGPLGLAEDKKCAVIDDFEAVIKRGDKKEVFELFKKNGMNDADATASMQKALGPKGLPGPSTIFEKGKVTSAEDGSWYVGYDKISIKDANNKELGFLSYHIDEVEPDMLEIGWSKVIEEHRGKGYQTEMFKKLFADHPEIRRIRTALDQSNLESFNQGVMNRVKAMSDYHPPTEINISGKILDRMTEKNEPYLRQLNECCSDYLKNLREKNPDKYTSLMKEATKDTPAWKTRDKFGFGSFGDMTNFKLNTYKDNSIQVFVEFDAQKIGSQIR